MNVSIFRKVPNLLLYSMADDMVLLQVNVPGMALSKSLMMPSLLYPYCVSCVGRE